MVRVALLLSSLLLAACPPTTGAKPCTGNPDCNLTAGGACLPSPLGTDQCAYPDTACPSGLSWGELSEGIAGQCVAIDAGIDGPDAPDAPIDAGPSNPIVDDYQLADLVIGQASFTTLQARGFSASSVEPSRIAATPEGLWVTDSTRNRILYFSPLPSIGDPDAILALGRPSLTDNAIISTPSASNLGTDLDVAAAGEKLVVSDRTRNRVLIWNTIPATSGVPADVVVGQPDMTSTASGSGAAQLASPSCVWTNGEKLAVCDSQNHRVLLWNTMPTTNATPADVVLGQAGFDVSLDPSTPTSSNIAYPWAVEFDGSRLYISDLRFNRVLVWTAFPTSNGAAASLVVGQALFSEQRDGAASAIYTKDATGIARYNDALLLADSGNSRIAIWQPLPIASGSAASLVLGQSNLDSGSSQTLPTQRDFRGLGEIAVVGDKLFVAELYNRRVVRFTLH